MEIENNLKKYLNDVLHVTINIEDKDISVDLPKILKLRYKLKNINILDENYIIAICKNEPVITEIINNFKIISERTGRKVILILPVIASYTRKRLIENKIQFIIPFKQMYLPDLMIDLREIFDSIKINSIYISPVSQFLIIYHLIKNNINGMTASDLSKILPYTKMSLSRAFLEIENLKVAEMKSDKISKKVFFKKKGIDLWNEVLPFLKNPINSSIFVENEINYKSLKISGINALANFSNINEEELSCFALFNKNHKIKNTPVTESLYKIELWKYDPDLLSDNKTVDPLSLYLTLKDSNDERVQKSLKELLGNIKW
jgi:hypothetical protein